MKAYIRRTQNSLKPRQRPVKTVAVSKTITADATEKSISLVKVVGLTMRWQEQNNHLQGLYAELGRLFYEQQTRRNTKVVKLRPTDTTTRVEKIAEIRKTMHRLEREIKALRNAA